MRQFLRWPIPIVSFNYPSTNQHLVRAHCIQIEWFCLQFAKLILRSSLMRATLFFPAFSSYSGWEKYSYPLYTSALPSVKLSLFVTPRKTWALNNKTMLLLCIVHNTSACFALHTSADINYSNGWRNHILTTSHDYSKPLLTYLQLLMVAFEDACKSASRSVCKNAFM